MIPELKNPITENYKSIKELVLSDIRPLSRQNLLRTYLDLK